LGLLEDAFFMTLEMCDEKGRDLVWDECVYLGGGDGPAQWGYSLETDIWEILYFETKSPLSHYTFQNKCGHVRRLFCVSSWFAYFLRDKYGL
jgi:hypothetical protein